MITVARFSLAIEAHIARAKLESEGIPAFVADEHTITAQWLYSDAMGGVRLQVPNSCAQAAREILAEDHSESVIEEQGFDPLICPNCGGNQLAPMIEGKRLAWLTILVFNVPLWPFRRQVKCQGCEQVFAYKP